MEGQAERLKERLERVTTEYCGLLAFLYGNYKGAGLELNHCKKDFSRFQRVSDILDKYIFIIDPKIPDGERIRVGERGNSILKNIFKRYGLEDSDFSTETLKFYAERWNKPIGSEPEIENKLLVAIIEEDKKRTH